MVELGVGFGLEREVEEDACAAKQKGQHGDSFEIDAASDRFKATLPLDRLGRPLGQRGDPEGTEAAHEIDASQEDQCRSHTRSFGQRKRRCATKHPTKDMKIPT